MTSTPVLLCTGANKGIGLAIVEGMLEQAPSWQYILASRNEDSGREAAAELRTKYASAKLDVMQLDVTNDAHIEEAAAHIKTKFGRLDVLVNNAGILRPPEFEGMTLRTMMNETLNTNLTSTAVLTNALLPLLQATHGARVINVTSGISSIANVLDPAVRIARSITYGPSKTGMNGLAAQMQAQEWDRVRAAEGKEGEEVGVVRFFTMQPGVTRTSFTRYTIGKEPSEGARAAVQLALDSEAKYPGGSFWEWEQGEMRRVPW